MDGRHLRPTQPQECHPLRCVSLTPRPTDDSGKALAAPKTHLLDALKNPLTILIAEDDEGHAYLVQENLRRAGLKNPIEHFTDGEEILNFLFQRGGGRGD